MSVPWKNINCLFLMSYVLVWSSLSCVIIGKGTATSPTSDSVITSPQPDIIPTCDNESTSSQPGWDGSKSGKLKVTYDNGSPRSLYSDETTKLECHFQGRPLPRVVWHKDGKAVINGTKGFYHTEKLSEDYQDTVEATLFIPGLEENEGYYTCIANNSICHRSSDHEQSVEFEAIYQCPFSRIQATDSQIDTTIFSNTTLSCLVEDEYDFCDLKWFFKNNSLASQLYKNKYKIELKETSSRCKKVFNLIVVNATFDDEGTYSCHQFCKFQKWFNSSAVMKLNVGRQLLISYNSKDSTWVTENLTPLLNEHSIHYKLQQSINQNMADSAVHLSRQLLIVLSEDYPASSFCRKARKMSLWRVMGQSDRPVILVSIGEAREWQLKALSCLGNKTSLEFQEQKKDDWQKKLLDVL